eukprot:scaffold9737_cov72-Phaeocystis_antarctica.AAC.6
MAPRLHFGSVILACTMIASAHPFFLLYHLEHAILFDVLYKAVYTVLSESPRAVLTPAEDIRAPGSNGVTCNTQHVLYIVLRGATILHIYLKAVSTGPRGISHDLISESAYGRYQLETVVVAVEVAGVTRVVVVVVVVVRVEAVCPARRPVAAGVGSAPGEDQGARLLTHLVPPVAGPHRRTYLLDAIRPAPVDVLLLDTPAWAHEVARGVVHMHLRELHVGWLDLDALANARHSHREAPRLAFKGPDDLRGAAIEVTARHQAVQLHLVALPQAEGARVVHDERRLAGSGRLLLRNGRPRLRCGRCLGPWRPAARPSFSSPS